MTAEAIKDLQPIPSSGVLLSNLFFEVNRRLSASPDVWNGDSESITGDTMAALLISAGAAVTINLIQRLNPRGTYSTTTTYTLYDFVVLNGVRYAYIGSAPASGNDPPNAAYWVEISQDGANGANPFTTITDTAPVAIPAVGSTVSYGVASSAGFLVGQIVSVGTAQSLLVSAIASSTSITVQNIDATAGTAVASGAYVSITGKTGTAGANGTNGTNGANPYTTITDTTPVAIPAVGSTVSYGVASSAGFVVGQIVAVGSAQTLQVIAKTATSITVQNIDSVAGTAVTSGAYVAVAGRAGINGTNGINAIAVTTGTNPNIPAIGTSATYTVVNASGIVVQQYYGFSGILGVLLATTVTSTSVTLQNVNAAAGTGVPTSTTLAPAGAPGAAGSGGGGSGTGLVWSEQTASTGTLAANTGTISNTTAAQTLTLESSPTEGDIVEVVGKGSGVWSIKGGAIYAPDGTNNTGVQRLSTYQYASVRMVYTAPNWVITNPAAMTGIQLYAGSQDTRVTNIVNALTAAGAAPTSTELSALQSAITNLDAIINWANVVCWYPFYGSSKATGKIDFKDPSNTAKYLYLGANDNIGSSGLINTTNNGSTTNIPSAGIASATTTTSYEAILASYNVTGLSNQGQSVIFSDKSFRYSLTLFLNTIQASCTQSNNPAVNYALTPTVNNNVSTLKANSVISAVAGTATGKVDARYIQNGTYLAHTGDQSRGSIDTSAGLGLFNSPIYGGFYNTANLSNFIMLTTGTGLTSAQEVALSNWDTTFQSALGR